MGFEDGSKAIVIFSRNRVVFVVVALAALEGQSNESPRGVLNGFVQPSGPIEKKVVAGQEAGRSESSSSEEKAHRLRAFPESFDHSPCLH